MHLRTSCSALLAGLAVAAAQFSFPVKSTALKPGEGCQIKWNTKGLQGPLSINLVPTDSLGSSIVAQRIAGPSRSLAYRARGCSCRHGAVNVENTGVLAWAPDLSIAAFPSFSMVIVDARSNVIVSDPFLIGSLTQQPALITAQIPQLATLTSKDSGGKVVTRTVTADMKKKVVPSPTGPIKLHQSGTQVLDSIAGAGPTDQAASDGLKPLPAFAGGDDQDKGGALQPLPNVPRDGSRQETTAARDQKQQATKRQGNPGAQPTEKSAASTEKAAANTGEAAKATSSTSSSAEAPTPPPAEKAAAPEQVTTSAAAAPEQPVPRVVDLGSDEAAAVDPSTPPGVKFNAEAQVATASLRPLPGTVTEPASLDPLAPRPSFTTLSDLTLSPSPIKATGKARESGSKIMNSAASGMGIAYGALTGLAGLAALAAAVVL